MRPISTSRRPWRGVPHPVIAVRSGRGDRRAPASLHVMVLIQSLTTIALFLLTLFSDPAECCTVKSVALPGAVNTRELIIAPVVSVNRSQILVNDHPVGSASELVAEGRVRPRLDELFGALKTLKDDWKKTTPEGRHFPAVVLLEVNEDVPAVVVVSVYRTCAAAGYINVSLVARSSR